MVSGGSSCVVDNGECGWCLALMEVSFRNRTSRFCCGGCTGEGWWWKLVVVAR